MLCIDNDTITHLNRNSVIAIHAAYIFSRHLVSQNTANKTIITLVA